MGYEDYKHWRLRWLRWHSRSLLTSALRLREAERDAYLGGMHRAYCSHGDFTENEIDFIFRRVSQGIWKLQLRPDAFELAQRAQERIREQGLRLMADASKLASLHG